MYIVPFGGIPPEPSDTVAAPAKPMDTFLWGKSYLLDEDGSAEFIRADVKAKREDEERLAELEAAIERARNGEEEPQMPGADEADSSPDENELSPEQLREIRFEWVDKRFTDELLKYKGSSGTLIFYADDEEFDIPKMKKFVEEGRDILTSSGKVRKDLIKVIFGGYRDYPIVEYHLVPKNSKNPQATPAERPEPIEEHSDDK